MVNVLAMPVVVGMKTARERFAGADNTLTLEGMMGDGKALQMAHQPRARPELRRARSASSSSTTPARSRPRGPRRGVRRRAWSVG